MAERLLDRQVAALGERLMAVSAGMQNEPPSQQPVSSEVPEEICSILTELQAVARGLQPQDENHHAYLPVVGKIRQVVLAASSKEGLLQRVVNAACNFTGARFGAVGHGLREGAFRFTTTSRGENGAVDQPPETTWNPNADAYLGLFENQTCIRLTDDQLRSHRLWPALADGQSPLRGLLAARLMGEDGSTVGVLVVSDKNDGDFTATNEYVLDLLGMMTSFRLEHIDAESDLRNWAQENTAIFASMADGVTVFDADCKPLRINSAARIALGLEEQDVDIESAFGAVRICYPDGRALRDEELPRQRALRGEIVRNERLVVTNTKGQTLIILASASPVVIEGQLSRVVLTWHDITEKEQYAETVQHLRRRLKEEQSFAGIVGRDPKMLQIFETIRDLAEVDAPVLIEGESGTGKELVAAAIHNESPRADKRFVPVNCSALPETLLESELFGHVRGAFTGAIRDKRGRFELADGGTIFLDEIGDLSPTIQVKLLRVLQEGTFERVGSERTHKVNVRVISATNKHLADEVAKKNIREDLYYRLCVIPLRLPPLRERRTDIPLLANCFLKKALQERGGGEIVLSAESLELMMEYNWPGNVREFQNFIYYALVKCKDNILDPYDFPPALLREDSPTQDSRKMKLTPNAVRRALEECHGNKAAAARRLGVSRVTLYRLLNGSSTLTGYIASLLGIGE